VILYLVRHGETEYNRQGLALGRADIPLNERGLGQLERIADALASEPIAAVYSSPLSRAMLVAQAIAARKGLLVQPRPALIEMSVGEVEGIPFAELRRRFPDFLEKWAGADGPATPMPGGERLVDVQRRAWEAVQSLRTLHPDETVCAVTHNFVILTILASALGLDLAAFRSLRHSIGAISVLDVRPEHARVVRMNDTCHLDDAN
jgi:broad specificity phosphatase PhoE